VSVFGYQGSEVAAPALIDHGCYAEIAAPPAQGMY
jgi:hypothetical protein